MKMEKEVEIGRRKKKRNKKDVDGKGKEKEEDPVPSTSIEFFRKWSELPELALDSILRRLLSIPDLFSFASVCRSWRSLPSPALNSFPPLLFLPSRSSGPSWSHSTLRTLTLDSFPSNLPTKTLTHLPCLGYSRGRLIFLSAHRRRLLLADVFTGELTRIPSPSPLHETPRIALLTASGTLFLVSDSETIRYRLGTDPYLFRFNRGAASLSAFRSSILSLDSASSRLSILIIAGDDITFFNGKPPVAPLPEISGPFLHCHDFRPRLVECGGELMLLRFALHLLPPVRRRIDVFRLDVETWTWAEVEGLGNWCIFVDLLGSCATACPEPARWGGRSNCMYVAAEGAGRDNWVVVPLDGPRLFEMDEPNIRLFRWPSPVWVYPSALHRKSA